MNRKSEMCFFKKNRAVAVALALFALAGGDGLAQNVMPPVNDAVRFPKGDAAWSVRVVQERFSPRVGKAPPASRSASRVDVTRVGEVRRDTVTWSDGTATEYWRPKGTKALLFQEPGGKVRCVRLTSVESAKYDEEAFDWIGKECFVGVQPYDGKECRYYEKTTKNISGDSWTYRAWIDGKNFVPVALSINNVTAVFSFNAAPLPGALAVPANFQETLKKAQAYLAPPRRSGAP